MTAAAAADQSSEGVLLTRRRGQLTKLRVKRDVTLPKGKPATSRTDRTASAVHASATYKRGCQRLQQGCCSRGSNSNCQLLRIASPEPGHMDEAIWMAHQPHNRKMALEHSPHLHQCLSHHILAHQSLEACLRISLGGFCAPSL